MKKTRLTALLTALVLLLSSAFISCSTPEGEQATLPASETAEPETRDPRSTLDVEETDMGGRTVRVLTVDGGERLMTFFDTDSITGEAVKDALYERNRLIEARFHMQFESGADTWENTFEIMRKQVQSGSNGETDYDLIMEICRNAYTLATENMLVDYANLPYIDIDKDYYFNEVNRQFSIGGHTFFAYGYDAINVIAQANSIQFNKKYATEYNIGNLYADVDNGTWTYDRFITAAQAVATDTNGDGQMKVADDIMGTVGRTDYTLGACWVSAGELMMEKDENDLPVWTATDNERLVTVLQKILAYLQTDSNTFCNQAESIENFTSGHAMFLIGGLNTLFETKGMTTDYGVLPWPKYDEAQDRYYSRLIDGWLNCVPTNCSDPAAISVIMQALAYYSAETVHDAYLSQSLSARWIRDEESARMVRLVIDTVTVDLSDTVWYASFRGDMTGKLTAKGAYTRITSILKSYQNTAKVKIRSVSKFLETLEQ